MSSNDRFDSNPLVTSQAAMSELTELPETLRGALYRTLAKKQLMEDDPLWWFLVANASLLKAFLTELPPKIIGNNGIQPGQLKSTQLEAIALSLKSLPGRDDVGSKQDLQALQQEVARVAQALQKIEQACEKQVPELRLVTEDIKFATGAMNKKLSEAGVKPPETWWIKWLKGIGVAAVIALIFFLAGRYVDACQEAIDASQANARLIDALKRLPSASNVTTFLRSKGADLTIDKIKLADGRDGTGIIISPGTLKLGPPSMSQEGGNALVPIR